MTTTINDILNRKPLDAQVYDRSDLEKTSGCPFEAKAIRDGKVKDVSMLADVGIEGHRLLAESLESVDENYLDLVDYLENELPTARPDIQPEVIKSLRGATEELRKIDPGRIIGIEKQYSTEFLKATRNHGAIVLTCCQDLLLAGKDETVVILFDWKTGYKRRTSTDAQSDFQTCFYSWILFRELPKVQTIHFFYEQTRYGTRAYAKLERERDYYNFEGRIQETVRLRMEDSNEAWPGMEKCCWCCVTAICPHVVGEALELNKDKEGYLNQYIALKARVAAIERGMKAHCKKHGEIRSGNQVFGYKETKKIVSYKLYVDKPDKTNNEDE